jgi:molecular chaperone DnaJ
MPVQTEWLEKDYYEVLGVPETATEKDIQRAYRKLARQLHPDANPDDPTAEARFKDVAAAYEVIGHAEKRQEYDEIRRLGPMAGGPGGPAGPGGPGTGGFRFEAANLGDLDLGSLFGDLLGGASGGHSRPRAVRGQDLEAELHLPFEDAVLGTTTQLSMRGTTTQVRIPAGVEDGQRIRLAGRGGPAPGGGQPGDLFIAVRVEPHRLFGRKGPNLTLAVPVTYPEAALGADIKVPTLDGPPVTLRIPAGTPSGRTLRVRGHGAPRRDGGRGDLLVTVEVAVPRTLGDAERRAVEALAEATTGDPRQHLGV